jgi:hypothetical protein
MNLRRLALPAALAAAAAGLGAQPAGAATAQIHDRVLLVDGTRKADRITLRVRSAAPRFLAVAGRRFRRSRFDRIDVRARGGRDVVRIDDSQVAFTAGTPATLDGGGDGDTLVGGRGRDTLVGRGGWDAVDGNGGADLVFLGSGKDRSTWNPGDGNDAVEGQAGRDELRFNGSSADETLAVSANGVRASLTRDVGAVNMDLDGIERIAAYPLAGADTITVGDLSGTLLADVDANLTHALGATTGDAQPDRLVVTGTDAIDNVAVTGSGGILSVAGLHASVGLVRAEGGSDTVLVEALDGEDVVDASGLAAGTAELEVEGGGLRDLVIGSNGSDLVDGGAGNDVAVLGPGDDVFRWDPGEGSDVVEGQMGRDALDFNGSGADERFELTANGARARFARDVGAVTIDMDDVERVYTAALGGADALTQGDMTGTDVTGAETDLGGADGRADRLLVVGTEGADAVEALGDAAGTDVVGLHAMARARGTEAADGLTIAMLGGDDRFAAPALADAAMTLTVDAGPDRDVVTGGRGADLLLAGTGPDLVDGEQGDDTAFLGPDDDVFRWDPGDGSDVVEGLPGRDELVFNGSGASEILDLAANGARARLTRDVGAVAMDLDGIERLTANVLGGADDLLVGDLTGTALRDVDADFAGIAGGASGDGQVDRVSVDGTDGVDAIAVAGANGSVETTGLPAAVGITRAEGDRDVLRVRTRGGADTVDDSALAAGTIALNVVP